MKKKIIIGAAALVAGLGVVGLLISKRGGKPAADMALPAPEVKNVPILALIDLRASGREFSKRELERSMLSEILWAAFGKNSAGRRTIPTAKNEQKLGVYAITGAGAWAYDGEKNRLMIRSKKDLRPLFAQQDYVLTAPLTLLYTGTDAEFSPVHAGAALENVSLYAASMGLTQVVRAYYDKEAVAKALALPEAEKPIISQTIGWPEQK
ncbi:MAG: nitroreductase family protein [Rickettsiales bacterium]|nr:nitroreductase family protein [Rickettsiales bacterium]